MTHSLKRNDGMSLHIEILQEDIIHLAGYGLDGPIEQILNRYGLIETLPASKKSVWQNNTAYLDNGYSLAVAVDLSFSLIRNGSPILNTIGGEIPGTASTYHTNKGFRWEISMGHEEKFIGFGDQQRDEFLLNNRKGMLWVRYSKSNIPVTLYMSSFGYGVVFNTTRRLHYDFGTASSGKAVFKVQKEYLDVYIIPGATYQEIIRKYTLLTGRPSLPPEFTFGLWLICQEKIRLHELMQVAREMRNAEVPCDILSLEPGWMETNYDQSVNKKWHPDRFPYYHYADKGPQTFINALKNMGYRFGLWLCCEWDFTWEEERRANTHHEVKNEPELTLTREEAGAVIDDQHIGYPSTMDKVTKTDQPWYEHLKKFVDQGVDFFKLDGCAQIDPHPDRLYGNGRTDEEMHNLNFVLYSGQMIKDFEAHTKRRGFVLSTGGWTGFQRYPGTWAGDTGTGSTVLCGMLQTALVGHSCTTCDMEIDSPEHMHMGLLTAWAHINSWDYCRYPVYRGDVLLNAFRDYINLRMRLLPLYYSLAWEGTRNGMPIMRPMLLTYPDREEAYSLSRQYLLGDAFLVSVFGKTITLPDGKWFDWWTGSIHKGDWSEREIEFPNDRGGHLMVRHGSVFPMREVQLHTGERPLEKITWVVFPDAASGKFTLYLDNGIDLTYREGSYAAAQFTCEPTKDGFILQWHPIEGNEPGRIRMLTYDIELLALSGTTQISVDGKPVQAEYDTKRNRIVIRGTKYGQVIRVMV